LPGVCISAGFSEALSLRPDTFSDTSFGLTPGNLHGNGERFTNVYMDANTDVIP
jgi:hypothetical protein